MTTPSRRSHRALVPLLAFVGLALGATPAVADVISDEEAECRDKSKGDPCTLSGQAGQCAASKCGKNDYSDGVPPKHVEVDCLVCRPGDAEAPADADPKAAAADPKATTVEPTKTAGDAKNTEVPKTKGCGSAQIGDPSLAGGSGVLGIVLAGLALRRRRGRSRP